VETGIEATVCLRTRARLGLKMTLKAEELSSTAELKTDAGLKSNANLSLRVAVQSKTAVEASAWLEAMWKATEEANSCAHA
jgi:hypothetical protein